MRICIAAVDTSFARRRVLLLFPANVMNLFPATKLLRRQALSRYLYTAADSYPFATLIRCLELAIERQSLKLTQRLHAQVLCWNLHQNPFIATKLITSYAACKKPGHGEVVFRGVREKNVYLWNTLINGYVRNCEYEYVFQLFREMCAGTVCPDDFTFSTLCKVSGEVGDLGFAKYVHGKCVRAGVVLDVVVSNSIMSMYLKCGEFFNSLNVFDEMPVRNLSSWNVVVNGYSMSGELETSETVSRLFRRMDKDGVRPNAFTLSSILPMCVKNGYGREIHSYIVRSEDLSSSSDVHLGCSLVDMYSRSGKVLIARQVFDRMESRNVFAWTAMINGFVRNEYFEEAVMLFKEMQLRDCIPPNNVSLVSVLPACSSLAGLIGGKQIHGYSIRRSLSSATSLSNALIDMYFKCGSICYAQGVFEDGNFCKDSISWSSMISGYGLHGLGRDAVRTLYKMLGHGFKPDMISLVGVLSACSRSGLVKEGLEIYKTATNEHGFEPSLEMCACMVDMLSRAGQLKEALEFVQNMPIKPGPSVWGALINACIAHGDSEMLELAYGVLIHMEPENPSNYVSLSNICAFSRKWDVVAKVRTMMKGKGLRKTPGFSWIDVNNQSHHFYVADKHHSCSDLIYEMLDHLSSMMRRNNIDFDLMNLT